MCFSLLLCVKFGLIVVRAYTHNSGVLMLGNQDAITTPVIVPHFTDTVHHCVEHYEVRPHSQRLVAGAARRL